MLAAAVTPRPALAQAGFAEQLFREGRALMDQERYAEACPKLAESHRLEPATGTLLNLATCHERQGRLASAWVEYGEVQTRARRDSRQDRAEFAAERMAALEKQLSRVKLELAQGADLTGLQVTIDGAEVGRPALGVAMPIDAGSHTLSASAPGRQPWEQRFEVVAGAPTQTLTIPELPTAPAQGFTPSTVATAPSPVAKASSASPGKGQRIAGYTLMGVGAVGVGLGSYFGLRAISKYHDSNDQGCVENQCSPGAAETRNQALSAGRVATIAFIAGGVVAAGGVVLVLTAPRASREAGATATLTPLAGGGFVQVGSRW